MRNGTLVALLGLVLLVGCGTDSSIDTSGYLFGDFEVVEFGLDTSTGIPQAARFPLRFAGDGIVQGDADGDGVFEPIGTYGMNGDGTLDLGGATGIMNIGGDVLATGTLVEIPDLAIQAAVRMSRGMHASVMSGSYVICVIRGDALTGECSTRLVSGHISETGRMNWTILEDSAGATGGGTWTFDVANGQLGLAGYLGAVKFDGSVFIASMQDAAEGSIMVGIRRDIATPERLRGQYVGYSFANNVAGCVTGRFTMQADGTRANVSHAWSDGSHDADSFPYAVSGEGFFSIEGERFGAVTMDGSIFAGVDTDASDGEVSFHFGIRSRD